MLNLCILRRKKAGYVYTPPVEVQAKSSSIFGFRNGNSGADSVELENQDDVL